MANGNGLLSIKVDLKRWKELSDEERTEHTFFALQYLTQEAQKNKFTERLLAFAGSFVASLVALIPTIWIIVRMIQGNGG